MACHCMSECKDRRVFMTYKHYLLVNHLADSPSAWESYHLSFGDFFPLFPAPMRKQILDRSYIYRFTNFDFM
ncbi:hypothetical protein [Sigmofec virus UA08Rod_5433]|uniref:Uncharacterized protein n=1 Tax=Sigmofec virus UA08Rod_5433 TaxID=2929424 RepID=A0A976R6Z4_9VIRU|nr:hypothetical protein [Sigmofec virus UA08Rod_5433]